MDDQGFGRAEQTNGISSITFWGRFTSSEMEEKFRGESLDEDLRRARFLFLVVTLSVATTFLVDWKVMGVTRVFLILVGTRSLTVSCTAILFLRLRHSIAPQLLDRWLLAWIILALLVAIYSLSNHPPGVMNALSVFVIVIVSLLVPMPFSFQVWTATVFTLAVMGTLTSKKPDSFMLLSSLTAMALTLVVGLACSRELHRARRESFAARLLERQTIGKLEAALGQVRNLEGILPICAWCKKIRREDGGWTVLEKYISERSEARFSHSLCPECAPKYFPDPLTSANQDVTRP